LTKKYEVKLTQHAQDDLENIFYFISVDSTKKASKFIIELEEKIYSLEHVPKRNPLITENEYFGTDYRHLIYKKYRIIYRLIENTVFILRVIHGAKLLDL